LVTLTSSQSRHANVILQSQSVSQCNILYTDLRNKSVERIVCHKTS